MAIGAPTAKAVDVVNRFKNFLLWFPGSIGIITSFLFVYKQIQ